MLDRLRIRNFPGREQTLSYANNSSLIEVLGNGISETSKELWKKWIIHFEVQLIKNHYISACCQRMLLNLFNAVWDALVPGIYKETGPRPGGTPVNGRKAWISENAPFAIWYVPDDNSWVVGNFSEIGNDGFVYLKGEGDAKCPQKVKKSPTISPTWCLEI